MARRDLAIVGIGCRYPGGADTPQEFYEFLRDGRDGFCAIPEERWNTERFSDPDPNVPLRGQTYEAALLDEDRLFDFDAEFFGLSPREADVMDPQQRLLLETSWEAFEDAGYPPITDEGRNVGVYVGVFTLDNFLIRYDPSNAGMMSAATAAAATAVMMSNRLSFFYNFHGPSLTIDTACSSSLVALNYACRDIWDGKIEAALVAGSNAQLSPAIYDGMSKGGFLSPSSRCKTFDEAADGYARGEGAGALVIKPIDAAMADGDRIYAVIKGIDVNQDGRTMGISAPNMDAQRALIETVFKKFHLSRDQVVLVEAHGTGTAIGDPIEVRALSGALGKRGENGKRFIGSVKGNIGHQEAGAGVAGVIKTAMCLYHNEALPQSNLASLNPMLELDEGSLEIPADPQSLPEVDGEVLACVNSFGYGGTNAHAVLAAAPAATRTPVEDGAQALPLVTLSGRDEAAVRELSGDVADAIEANPGRYDEILNGLQTGRSHLERRLAFSADTSSEAVERLRAVRDEAIEDHPIEQGVAAESDAGLVFVYTGMGPQWWGMGRELFDREPVFRSAIEAADSAFKRHSGWSILAEMLVDQTASRMPSNEIAQPANFVLQHALTQLLDHWGLKPSLIVGHSVGEIAAAEAAGALSLDDAAKVAFHRSRVQQMRAGKGRMLATGLDRDSAADIAKVYAPAITLAAINGPTSTALSGDLEALQEIAAELENNQTFNRLIPGEVAYHSHQMEGLQGDLREALADLSPRKPSIPMYSTVTGREVTRRVHNANYWWRNVRQPVEFASVVSALAQRGYKSFIEIGPHPVLASSVRETFAEHGARSAVTVASLTREAPEHDGLMRAMARLWCTGVNLAWRAPNNTWHDVLPHYPWQRSRHWSESRASRLYRLGKNDHPLLGLRLAEPLPTWEVTYPSHILKFFGDHVIGASAILPAAGYVETFLAACEAMSPDRPFFLSNVQFKAMLNIPDKDTLRVRTIVSGDELSLHARTVAADGDWREFASARLVRQHRTVEGVSPVTFDRTEPTGRMAGEEAYRRLANMGLHYKDAFQTIESVCIYESGVEGTLSNPASARLDGFRSMPALFDGGLQLLALMFEGVGATPLPVQVSFVSLFTDQIPQTVKVTGELQRNLSGVPGARLLFTDEDDRPVMELSGIQTRLMRLPQTASSDALLRHYAYHWKEHVPALSEHPGDVTVIEQTNGSGSEAHAALQSANGNGSNGDIMSSNGSDTDAEPNTVGFEFKVAFAGAGRETIQGLQDTSPTELMSRRYKAEATLEEPAVAANGNGTDEPDTEALETGAMLGDDAEPSREFILWCADTAVGTEPRVGDVWQFADFARGLADVSDTRVVLCTRFARRVAGDDRSCPGQAALWGLARTIRNELSGTDVLCVDFDGRQASYDRFWADVAELPANAEVAFRDGKLFYCELEFSDEQPDKDSEVPVPTASEDRYGWDLEVSEKRGIDGLRFRMSERLRPAAGEVEVRVDAVSINFKDILKVYGRLTDQTLSGTFSGSSVGLEAVGTIVRAGAGREGEIGEQIIFMAREGCFRRYITMDPDKEIVLRWQNLPFSAAELASVPIVYFTAHYGLLEVGRLRRGESVLLHSAAGGVGHAAIQVAKAAGADVVATAGTEEKRDYLRSLGVQHVFDSRSLDFEQQVLEATSGRGVDVILNFLPDAQLHANLRVLKPFGRLVEIGKLDIGLNRGLPLAEFERNLTFSSVDFDHMTSSDPALCRRLAEDIRERFESGDYKPNSVTVWPASKIHDCFRELVDGRHIGKHVVDFNEPPEDVLPRLARSSVPSLNATYIVTGGFGGFGLSTAEWLVRGGAGCVVLAGRTVHEGEALERLRKIAEEAGAQIVCVACDVGALADVRRLLTGDVDGLPPVRGIFHAAAVLEDGFLTEQSEEKFTTAFHAKARGAYNLHRASIEFALNLDHFVLYSSISGVMGNAAQANYAAANVYLDALAEFRRERGLPGLSIAWGAIEDVGMLTRDNGVARLLEARGIKPFTSAAALESLSSVLRSGTVNTGIFQIDWETTARSLKVEKGEVLWSLISRATGADLGSDLADFVRGLSPAEGIAAVQDFIVAELARVTGRDVENILPERTLIMQGLDSLMVVELQIALEQSTGVDIGLNMNDMQSSIMALAETIYHRLAATQAAGDDNSLALDDETRNRLSHVMADLDVDALSDEQVDMLLNEVLVTEETHDEHAVQ